MVSISVITPTYCIGDDLWKFVLSVQRQLNETDELIIVDNDKSAYAQKIAALKKVQYHQLAENRGPCPARNYGARLSKNKWLLFLDDDGLAPDGMLEALRNIIRNNPDFYAIRGKIIPKNDTIYNYLQSLYDMGDRPMPYFLNLEGITAIRKTELDAVDGWNNELYGHEGIELSYRLIDRFGPDNCQYHPDLVLRHDYSDSLLKYLNKDVRHSADPNSVRKKTREKYSHLEPVINQYRKLTPNLQEAIKVLPENKQKKIQLFLRLSDIYHRRPIIRQLLFSVLNGLKVIGIKL